MADLIDRQAAIDALRNDPMGGLNYESILGSLPPTTPECKPPIFVAEDRFVKNMFAVFPHCPKCNADIATGQCYCSICGQHIDWSEEDE